MRQSYFRRYGCSFRKMVNYLSLRELLVRDVLIRKAPLEIKTQTLRVFVLHPSSLLESTLYITIPTLYNKYLLRVFYFVFPFPLTQRCHLQQLSLLLNVPVYECLKRSIVVLH
jgi:hypothetical protein